MDKIKWPTPTTGLSGIFNLYNKDGNRPKVGDKLYHFNRQGKLALQQNMIDSVLNVCENNFTSACNINMRWVETLMGLPVGWTNPQCENPIYPHEMNYEGTYLKICNEVDSKKDECRLLGNGVVPSCAAKAFSVLLNELNGD